MHYTVLYCSHVYHCFDVKEIDKRSTVVSPGEMKKWQSLSYLFMTEESDVLNMYCNSFFNLFVIGLDDYINVLEDRLQQKGRKDLCGAVIVKERTIGSASTPTWSYLGHRR